MKTNSRASMKPTVECVERSGHIGARRPGILRQRHIACALFNSQATVPSNASECGKTIRCEISHRASLQYHPLNSLQSECIANAVPRLRAGK